MDFIRLIEQCGFSVVGRFNANELEARPEVRDMCAADLCVSYGKNWQCPPACGDLDYFREQFKLHDIGYVFQTVGHMEDEFDYEAIQIASQKHAERLDRLFEKITALNASATEDATSSSESSLPSPSSLKATRAKDILLLGAGACKLCETCTCPSAPCRNPHKTFPSMEAAGLLISEVCTLAKIPYYHGPRTIAFCSCVLV
jgi:predicted metal-binding protein